MADQVEHQESTTKAHALLAGEIANLRDRERELLTRLAEVEAERDDLVKVNAELGHYGLMQMDLTAAQEQVRTLQEAAKPFAALSQGKLMDLADWMETETDAPRVVTNLRDLARATVKLRAALAGSAQQPETT